ncbi:MAG: hypothetical protein ACYC4E_01115 [Carboxydocellales bacterium]
MRIKCTIVDIYTTTNGTYVKLLVNEPAVAIGRIELNIANKVVINQLALGQEYLMEITAIK